MSIRVAVENIFLDLKKNILIFHVNHQKFHMKYQALYFVLYNPCHAEYFLGVYKSGLGPTKSWASCMDPGEGGPGGQDPPEKSQKI